MSDKLLELAERCEKAEVGDGWLDCDIAIARGLPSRSPLHYTSSIDAAMTLVPEGWTAWDLRSSAARTRFVARVSRLVADDEEEVVAAHCHTPALALCAAALRALATKEPNHG